MSLDGFLGALVGGLISAAVLSLGLWIQYRRDQRSRLIGALEHLLQATGDAILLIHSSGLREDASRIGVQLANANVIAIAHARAAHEDALANALRGAYGELNEVVKIAASTSETERETALLRLGPAIAPYNQAIRDWLRDR